MATNTLLVMRMGPNPGLIFSLDKELIYLGRDRGNNIVINDVDVSRKHAKLTFQSGRYVLEDLGSTMGTFVNGERVKGFVELNIGDVVLLGKNIVLEYSTKDDNETATKNIPMINIHFDSYRTASQPIARNMGSKLHVFLCHSSQDKPIVRELYQRLNAEGWIDPWLDSEKLLPGMDWDLEIEKAVETSHIVLVCISNQSVNKEGYIQKELRLVLDVAMNMPEGGIFLIPLKLEACEIPRRLRSWQWMDFFPPQNRQFAYDRLLASLTLRADKLSIPHAARTADKRETPPVKPALASPSFPDLYLPPEYASNTFVAPKATVPSWILGDMEFVKVPRGKFLMGSSKQVTQAYDNEKPQHPLDIPYDFLVARFPVTNEQFSAFAKDTKLNRWGHDPQNKLKHPVVIVTWETAVAFCDWVNQKYRHEIPSSLVFRLPTEAEWEKAARGTEGLIYPWGNKFDSSNCNSSESGRGIATPVGAFSPQGDSLYGVCDMSGNVWEWTSSLCGKGGDKPDYGYPYKSSDGRENQKVGGDRILRGGSFDCNARDVRAAVRISRYLVSVDNGFRVVLAPALS